MPSPPVFEIDPNKFWEDPYPDLKRMRNETPVAYVPQLDAILVTRRDDVFTHEKMIDVFSSDQPDSLMTKLMGQNMMRKDGEPHITERKAIFPSVSPKTVKQVWKQKFETLTTNILTSIEPAGNADLVKEIAMPISGEALKAVTGLTQITAAEMDRVSQGMIDGCANYSGDPEIEANCNNCTASIEAYIEEMAPILIKSPDYSLLSVQMQAGLPQDQIIANIKLAISGGQNEPRDALAGAVWALLSHPDQLQSIQNGNATWQDAFEEYVRWMSPIGMSPRRITKPFDIHGFTLEAESRLFFMFGSANRDEEKFDNPDCFDLSQSTASAIAFGAGPHFCAGAWISRCLIAEVALPMIFNRLKDLTLTGETRFGGWAFRGPLTVPVKWEQK